MDPPSKITSTDAGGTGSGRCRTCVRRNDDQQQQGEMQHQRSADAGHPIRFRGLGSRSRTAGDAARARVIAGGVMSGRVAATTHAATLCRRATRQKRAPDRASGGYAGSTTVRKRRSFLTCRVTAFPPQTWPRTRWGPCFVNRAWAASHAVLCEIRLDTKFYCATSIVRRTKIIALRATVADLAVQRRRQLGSAPQPDGPSRCACPVASSRP